ncbi:UDP-4-amino-4,6-dideoxy-N-acetyl-beta-L-altrosamine transaminase [bacterium 210820-DFI.6.37]|nr:UDP-4-amino-4,6-dideoxy-N-acetyl-beta-L-altrosamine transaminase [bacterium 210820-DFI.6.37]
MKNDRRIPYGKQTILPEDIDAVVNVLKSDFLTQGPKLKIFEETVASYHGAKYAVAFANGTAALHGAYYAAGVVTGDEIITSPITFVASANAAIYCGGKPVFADIDLNTNCISIEEIEKKLTPSTKVITPVSLAGYPVDLKKIKKIADEAECYIIHDAAHAIGSKNNGTFGMEYADMAILSFHPVKHIATGEGGMVLTNNEELYRKLSLFRTHGITKSPELLEDNQGPWYYEMISLGFNYRMTDIQAALGISQFKRIDNNLRQRNQIAKIYNEELLTLDGMILPPNVGFEILEDASARSIHSYHLYTLRLESFYDRYKVYAYLHEHGIMAQIHYIPVHLQPYYRQHFGYQKGDYPNAEKYYNGEISLPMYHNMEFGDLEYIIDTIKRMTKNY